MMLQALGCSTWLSQHQSRRSTWRPLGCAASFHSYHDLWNTWGVSWDHGILRNILLLTRLRSLICDNILSHNIFLLLSYTLNNDEGMLKNPSLQMNEADLLSWKIVSLPSMRFWSHYKVYGIMVRFWFCFLLTPNVLDFPWEQINYHFN